MKQFDSEGDGPLAVMIRARGALRTAYREGEDFRAALQAGRSEEYLTKLRQVHLAEEPRQRVLARRIKELDHAIAELRGENDGEG